MDYVSGEGDHLRCHGDWRTDQQGSALGTDQGSVFHLLDTGRGISHDTGDRYGQVGGNIDDRVLAACIGGEGVSVHGHYGDGLVIVCVQGEGEGEAVAFGYRMRSGCRGGGGSYQGREGYGIGSGLWRRRRYGSYGSYGSRGRGERRGRGRAVYVYGYGGGN